MNAPAQLEMNRIHTIDGLRRLPENAVDCVMTSPPYWMTRDYGVPPHQASQRASGENRSPHATPSTWMLYGCRTHFGEHFQEVLDVGRAVFIGFELNPEYAKMARTRLQRVEPEDKEVRFDVASSRGAVTESA